MFNKDSILRRIQDFYDLPNRAALANFLGVNPSTLSNWVTRDTMDYELIFSKCKELNYEYILTGDGLMLKKKSGNSDFFSQENVTPECNPRMKPQNGEMYTQNVSPSLDNNQIDLSDMIATDSGVGIPLITADAMAGFLTGGDTQVMEYECERYVVPAFKGADFLIPVRGDSMMPKYIRGDIVACKKLPLDTFFQWNKVYIVDTTQGILIKRVRKGEDADHLLFVSENPEFEPFELHKSEVRGLAIVVGIIRRE